MKHIKETELRELKEDHIEVRKFVREISLKLRRQRSRNEDDLSLYEMVIDNQN